MRLTDEAAAMRIGAAGSACQKAVEHRSKVEHQIKVGHQIRFWHQPNFWHQAKFWRGAALPGFRMIRECMTDISHAILGGTLIKADPPCSRTPRV